MSDVLKGGVLVCLGALEGAAFLHTGIADPKCFSDQFQFRSWILMKLFLSAVGCSMLSQALLCKLRPAMFLEQRWFVLDPSGWARTVCGCSVLGAGMYIAGSGPTMMTAQLGAGMPHVPYVIAGALGGGAVFGLMEPRLNFRQFTSKAPQSVDAWLKTSYARVAIPFAVALLSGVAILEYIFPHKHDMEQLDMKVAHPLHPIVGGIIIGANQIPTRVFSGQGEGGTKSVMNIISTLTRGKLFPHFKLNSVAAAYQFLYLYVGAAAGAYGFARYWVSRGKGEYKPPESKGDFTEKRSFIGGAIMVLGAKFAGGCTCGHGVTGFSELAFQSMAGAMGVFGGAIACGQAHNLISGK